MDDIKMAFSPFFVLTPAGSNRLEANIMSLYVLEHTQLSTTPAHLKRSHDQLQTWNDHACHRYAYPSLRVLEFASTPVPSRAEQGSAHHRCSQRYCLSLRVFGFKSKVHGYRHAQNDETTSCLASCH
jgi:hypothetical protein